VLVRIADGVGIPRELINLAPAPAARTTPTLAVLRSDAGTAAVPDLRGPRGEGARPHPATRRAGCAYGSDPEVSRTAAAWATRLLDVPGAEAIK